MGHKIYNYKKNYIDEIFEFTGLWDMPSKCGLKIERQKDKVIVIVTDLYHENPGSSVTEFCARLANIIIKEKDIDPKKLVFIHHSPDLGSKYEFFTESFELVDFKTKDGQLSEPGWTEISKNKVEEMLRGK